MKILHFYFRLLFCHITFKMTEQTETKVYSEYNLNWEKFVACTMPSKPGCGFVNITNTQNMSDVIFKMDIGKECPMKTARVVIGAKQENSTATKKLWTYSLSSPCQHFVLGPVLIKAFNTTSKNCKINKGRYDVHVNMNHLSETFLGPKFFLGRYTFKTMAYNQNNMAFCADSQLGIVKKDGNKPNLKQ